MEIKSIKELPNNEAHLLYLLRAYDDSDVPFEEYIGRYLLIVVDDDVYYDDKDEFSKKMLREYQNSENGSVRRLALPHAIIKNSYVLKNRYGYNSYF